MMPDVHPLTRWILDHLPQNAALEECVVVAPTASASTALRTAIVQAGRELLGVHFATIPALARLMCDRHGVVCPIERPDPLEERAILERAVDRGTGPMRSYARQFPSALRELGGAVREWQAGGRPPAADDAWTRELVDIAERFTAAGAGFASRARLIELALQALERTDRTRGPHRVLLVAIPQQPDVEALCAALSSRDVEVLTWQPEASSSSPPRITRTSAPDMETELRAAAYACARSHAAGTPWRELAVAVPRLGAYAPHIRTAFAAEGVPFTSAVESPLLLEPRAAACVHAARVLFDDTPRRAYLGLLASPCAHFEVPPHELRVFDELTRRDHVHGRGELLREFIGFFRDELRRHNAPRMVAPERLEHWLAAAQAVPETASAAQRATALETFLNRNLRAPATPDSRDSVCSERITATLEAIRRASAIRDPQQDGKEFADEFEQLLRDRGMPLYGRCDDGVRIVEFDEALAHPVRHLQICGLAEGYVPVHGASDVFMRERDRSALGIPDRDAARAAQREALRTLCDHPTETLGLSRPRRDANDRPVAASMWMDEIVDPTIEEVREPTHPLSRARERASSGTCPRDLALLRVAVEARDVDAAALIAGPGVRHTWNTTRELEQFEAKTLARDGDLGQRIGAQLAEQRMSVSALRTFGYCPQQYLFKHTLALRTLPPEPDPCELPRDRLGIRIHTVLENLFVEYQSELAAATDCSALMEEMSRRAEKLLDHELARERGPLRRDFPTLHKLLVERWREALLRSLAQDLERMDRDGSRPFELEEDIQATLDLRTIDGRPIDLPLRGRADRIDRLPNGALRLIDFKTGATCERDVDEVEILRARRPQLPTYALMLRELDRPVDEATIRAVRPTTVDEPEIPFEHVLSETDQLPDGPFGQAFTESIAVLAALRARGAFVPGGEKSPCQWCDFRVACRRLHPPSAHRVRTCGIVEVERYFGVQRKSKRLKRLVRADES